MGSRVFWSIVAGFLLGVLLRSIVSIGWSFAYFAALLASVAFAFSYLDANKRRVYVIVAVFFTALACGVVRMGSATLRGDSMLTDRIGTQVALEGVVLKEPDARDSSTLVSISADVLLVGSTSVPIHAGIIAKAPAHARVSYGDRVRVSGELGVPKSFETGTDRVFDYPGYLAAQGIAYTLTYAQIVRVEEGHGNPFLAAVISLKQSYVHGMDAVLPEPESGLASGITVGDKRSDRKSVV